MQPPANGQCAQPPITNQELFERIQYTTRTLPGTPVVDMNDPSKNPANVQRVMQVFPSDEFEYLFPGRNPVYTYKGLLTAVAKWPAFCDDAAPGLTRDDTCRKELASTFAHFVQVIINISGVHSFEFGDYLLAINAGNWFKQS